MNLDQLRIWANDLRLSSGSSDQDDILRNEIKQEDENVDENVTNEFSTDMWHIQKQENFHEGYKYKKKKDCPFRVKGVKIRTGDDWMARVVCGTHNHALASYMEGHPYPGRLSESKIQLTAHLSTKNVKPRDILTSLKKQNPDNMSTIETIYNAHKKFRIAEKASKTQMQVVISFLQHEGYIFESRTNAVTNELEDLFFAHPGSLERRCVHSHMCY